VKKGQSLTEFSTVTADVANNRRCHQILATSTVRFSLGGVAGKKRRQEPNNYFGS
jgi:hypothetical protein